MSDTVPAPIAQPQFYCTEAHGATNAIVGLGGIRYCLACVTDLVGAHLPEVILMADFRP